MSTSPLAPMIVRNVGDLDRAAHHAERVGQQISALVDEAAEDWARTAGWDGEYDWWNSTLWLAAPRWRHEEADRWYAWFELDYGAGDTGKQEPGEDFFLLTRLCRAGRGRCGFRLRQEISGAKDWKKLIRAEATAFQQLGFTIDEGAAFMDFVVEAEKLALAIEEDGAERLINDSLSLVCDRLAASEELVTSLLYRAGNKPQLKARPPKR
ncbi:MAG: hypothetical protein JOZ90_10645 [Alphaproteobacteria bacterium]|nr:hypothetical protein [Alphaproteobacteria bacterium]MBV9371083.1 hypothetical protein [Alphaproteobacteria bacterium]MBV9901543.1 hypothetical protein [Alphaproteobacteria bacterium]